MSEDIKEYGWLKVCDSTSETEKQFQERYNLNNEKLAWKPKKIDEVSPLDKLKSSDVLSFSGFGAKYIPCEGSSSNEDQSVTILFDGKEGEVIEPYKIYEKPVTMEPVLHTSFDGDKLTISLESFNIKNENIIISSK